MAKDEIDAEGYHLEVLGACTTNTRAGSQFTQDVDAKYLWSYAQEEALVAVSEQGTDKCWRLITDPERRAKRIAARYADLYFRSAEKSKGQLQLYWPALAAFVVKDIVEAFRYTRTNVLTGGWRNAMRTSAVPSIVSNLWTDGSPYEHGLRVYTALAKGNLWLFMDIYPWLWYVLEYGLNKDGSLNEARLNAHVGLRDSAQFQQQSQQAMKELPFSANWMNRLKQRMAADPVYAKANSFFSTTPTWSGMDGGYGQHQANAYQAHAYVKAHVKEYDSGYRLPPSNYWSAFNESFYVMGEERRELSRVASDAEAAGKLLKIAKFAATDEVKNTYKTLIAEFARQDKNDKAAKQKSELRIVARQEQINVLQPLIYDDSKLVVTMDANHAISRYTPFSPKYAVYYSAAPHNDDPELQTVFDKPTGVWDYITGPGKSLPNPEHRMEFVARIAKDFDKLMDTKRSYMEGELRKIRGWLNA
jgi:hypothetical protein